MNNKIKRNLECFNCNQNNFQIFDKYYHGKRLGVKNILICNNCDLKQVDFIPDDERLNFFYKNLNTRLLFDVDKTKNKLEHSFNQFDTFLKFIISKSKLNIDEPKNFIDIGAGNGRTLHQLKNLTRWNSIGIEPDKTKCKILKFLDLKYINDTFQNVEKKLENNNYDLIVMSQVLEHIANPGELLDKIYNKLNKNGYLWIDVPLCNKNYFKSRMIDDVGHLYFFDEESLSKIIKKYKFDIISRGSIGNKIPSRRKLSSTLFLFFKYYLHRYAPISLLNLNKRISTNEIKSNIDEIFKKNDDKIEVENFENVKLFFLVRKN